MPLQRSRALAIAVAAIGLSSSSCSDEPDRFAIRGSVRIAGSPQPGVTIVISNRDGGGVAMSQADGSFEMLGAPNGVYQVTPLAAGVAFRPVSRVVTLLGGDVEFVNFAVDGGPVHTIGGLASDVWGITLSLTGDNTGAVLSRAGGNFTIPSLRVGSYTVTPSKTGRTFTPSSWEVTGVIDYAHNDSASIGVVSTTSVTYDNGAGDASAFFAFPSSSAGGIGTIRPRRASELAAAAAATYESLWQGAKTVTFVMNSGQGDQTILFHLLPDHTYSVTATNFRIGERLLNATGVRFFTAAP